MKNTKFKLRAASVQSNTMLNQYLNKVKYKNGEKILPQINAKRVHCNCLCNCWHKTLNNIGESASYIQGYFDNFTLCEITDIPLFKTN
jgi:hypothetical protein